MAKPTITTLAMCVALLFGAAACGPSLVIQDVDYSQPIESVLSPDSNNQVHDERYAIKFNISDLLEEEGASSVDKIRLIRNHAGYYFVTAAGFNNVYVFETDEGELKLENTIEISEDGLGEPAFNQRDGFVELVDMASGDTYNLNHEGRN